MTESLGRPTSPRVFEEHGRSRLCYPDIEVRGIAHGIVVFKDVCFGLDHAEWFEMVSRGLRRHLDPGPRLIAVPHQVHSARVIDLDGAGDGRLEADGLVTSTPLTAIGISVSDCVPLFAVDVDARVIGLAHCGWRGVAGGVVEELVRVLRSQGGNPDRATFLIGAAIGSCCYRVGQDLLEQFTMDEVRDFSRATDDGTFFDLKRVVASRLAALGARPDKISIDKTCTSCKKYLLSSYRADGRDCGRMLAFLMMTG